VLRPFAGHTAGFAQKAVRQFRDDAAVLGNRNELIGRHMAEIPVRPAGQRLEAPDLPARKVQDRLEVNLDFILRQGRPQSLLQQGPVQDRRVHLHLEEAIDRAAGRLGPVKCNVGPPQKLGDRKPVVRKDRDADAGADLNLTAFETDRLLDACQEASCQIRGIILLCEGRRDDGEFITAETGDHAVVAHFAGQPQRELAQQCVAKSMAVDIVDRLEAIDVEHHHRAALAMNGVGCQFRKSVEKLASVRQAGQRVMLCQLARLLLGNFMTADFALEVQQAEDAVDGACDGERQGIADDQIENPEKPGGTMLHQERMRPGLGEKVSDWDNRDGKPKTTSKSIAPQGLKQAHNFKARSDGVML